MSPLRAHVSERYQLVKFFLPARRKKQQIMNGKITTPHHCYSAITHFNHFLRLKTLREHLLFYYCHWGEIFRPRNKTKTDNKNETSRKFLATLFAPPRCWTDPEFSFSLSISKAHAFVIVKVFLLAARRIRLGTTHILMWGFEVFCFPPLVNVGNFFARIVFLSLAEAGQPHFVPNCGVSVVWKFGWHMRYCWKIEISGDLDGKSRCFFFFWILQHG